MTTIKTPGKARCSEAEFIELCKQHGLNDVARILGMQHSKVAERRRRIERDLGILLRPEAESNPEYSAIREITVTDGCVVVGNDAHYRPGDPPTMHRAMVKLLRTLKPVAVIANGDMADFPQLSRFPSIGWERNPTVKDELETIQDRMDELFKASRNAMHFWCAGNHDLRFESRIANTMEELRGVKGIHLKDHVPGWQPCWAVDVNKGTPSWTEVRHRDKGGKYASTNNTIEAGISVVTGHDHRADVVAYNDRRGRRYGVRTGMMADSPLDSQFRDYLEARRVNWQSAFGVLTYRNGELLQPELCMRVRPGVVEFRGEVIEV